MEAEGTEPLALMTVCVFVCVCFLWGFLDEAGLEVGAVAWGATEQQVLLVDQAVQQVFLSVVVIDLQEGQHRDAQPGEPGRPQAELWNSNNSRERHSVIVWMRRTTNPVVNPVPLLICVFNVTPLQ